MFALSLAACADAPVVDHSMDDHEVIRQLGTASHAEVRSETPFRQVGLMADSHSATFEYRIEGTNEWRPVEITWSEGVHLVGRAVLDEEATAIELRSDRPWEFANVQLYEEVVASSTLARDLPFETIDVNPSAVAPADLVIPRAAWGARSPDKICGSVVSPYRMAIHHTASPADDGGDAAARMRQMQAYHMDTNGWCDIGYHFVVSQAGAVYQGRSDERRPGAHVLNNNSGNVGICLIGNFQNQQVSDTQLNKAAEIVRWVGQTYDIPFNRTSIKGHREHSGQSTSCPGDNLLSRLDTLIARAAGTEPANGEWKADFQVRWLGETSDFYTEGSSAGKPDFFPGDALQAEILLKNANSTPIRNVQVGYWFESPFLSATNYKIETDAPGFDGATFMLNDSNDNPDNPAKDAMGEQGKLGLYAFAAGETKRIVVDLEVGPYSIGLADHPDVRGWLWHIDDVYGEQAAFNEEPTNANPFGALVQAYAELDVLSPYEWQFDGGEAEQREGWTGPAGLAVDPAAGALHAELTAGDGLDSPAWTAIDAGRWDQLVLRMTTSATEASKAALYWAGDGGSFSEERALVFIVEPGRTTHVVPVGEAGSWSGTVTQLRVVPLVESDGTADVDAIFFQSTTGEVGSERETLVSDPPVKIDTGDVPTPKAPEHDDDDLRPGNIDPEDIRVNTGCSASTGRPTALVLLIAFVAAALRRRRP